jgi:hypothetical protein
LGVISVHMIAEAFRWGEDSGHVLGPTVACLALFSLAFIQKYVSGCLTASLPQNFLPMNIIDIYLNAQARNLPTH